MKHPSSGAFFAYWDQKRGAARAPDRSDIEPDAVRELLGDIFVLSYDNEAGYPFRVAGTRVCALLGRDLKDASFSALFAPGSRRTPAGAYGRDARYDLPRVIRARNPSRSPARTTDRSRSTAYSRAASDSVP